MHVDLSIKIITYNRGPKLARTLSFIERTNLCDIDLEVLDNASTDSTSAVLADFAVRLNHMSVLRHKYNIGVYANILRAYERFETRYCWLMCDDDDYQDSEVDAMLQIIADAKFDLYIVGTPDPGSYRPGFNGTAAVLQSTGARIFNTTSFLPGAIFSRSILEDFVLLRCNKAASSCWPHMPLFEQILNKNCNVFVLPKPLVLRNKPDDYASLKVSSLYEIVRSAYYILPAFRKDYLVDMLNLNHRGPLGFCRLVAAERFQRVMTVWQYIFVAHIIRCCGFVYSGIVLVLLAVPVLIYRFFGWLIGKTHRNGAIPVEHSPRM